MLSKTKPPAKSQNLLQKLLSRAKQASDRPNSGPRNLVLLGLGATLITILTLTISLKLYHDSGDIYLDRSRPGFLPAKEEAEQEKDETDYVFSDTGVLSEADLAEFLTNLKQELNRLNDFSSEPFSPTPLSDDTLGL